MFRRHLVDLFLNVHHASVVSDVRLLPIQLVLLLHSDVIRNRHNDVLIPVSMPNSYVLGLTSFVDTDKFQVFFV